ncbi:LysR family transcriptional regulator [Streptomyces sp. NBC_00988]|uniref:LysR family transcriptional regulator n=1 Tax=Streptomyces sp. NBC_00988 TaxID=2903704 RepID=UPI00386B740D|nr:LysR family transcriptional regulator [Streptomyces sp. NBC_00988]
MEDLPANLDPRVTLQRLHAFVLTAEKRSPKEAADAMKMTASAIRQHLSTLDDVYGRPLLQKAEGGSWEVTEFGRKVLPAAQRAVHQWAQITRIGSTTVVVEFLPQHAYFVSPVAAQLRDRMEIKLAPLSEHDRDRSRFEEAVVGRVADGVSDLVVGLPPKSMAKLEKIPLYTSRLEAMIRDLGDESPDHLTLDEVAQHDLLLPPSAARSRELLEKALAEGLKETGTPHPVPVVEAYGTKVLVTLGEDGHGTVIVPSDVAYPFAKGNRLGGPISERFKWVPLRDRDGNELTQQVFVTTRPQPSEDVTKIITGLKEKVAELGLDVRSR